MAFVLQLYFAVACFCLVNIHVAVAVTNWTVSQYTLPPTPTRAFGATVVNNILYLMLGDAEYRMETFDMLSTPTPSNVWLQRQVSVHPSGMSLMYPYFWGRDWNGDENIWYNILPQIEGSFDPPPTYQTLLKYDFSTHSYAVDGSTYNWKAPIRHVRGCATFNARLNVFYIISGDVDDNKQTTQYNLTADSWLSLNEYNVFPRHWCGCAMDIGYESVFLFGGRDDSQSTFYDTIQRYDVGQNVWSELAPPLTLSDTLAMQKCILFKNMDNNIYCVGGYNDLVGRSNQVYIFNPSEMSIDGHSLQLTQRKTSGFLLLHQNCLYSLGGMDVNGQSLHTIEYYCVSTPATTPAPTPAPTPVPTAIPIALPTTMPTTMPSTAPTTMAPTNTSTLTAVEIQTTNPTTNAPTANPTTAAQLPSTSTQQTANAFSFGTWLASVSWWLIGFVCLSVLTLLVIIAAAFYYKWRTLEIKDKSIVLTIRINAYMHEHYNQINYDILQEI